MNGAWNRTALLTGAALGLIVTVGASHGAWAQAPAAAPKTASPAQDAARTAFEALPEADRKALQDGLIWAGHYTGIADGTFGRQTFDAIAAYQQSVGKPATGILNPADRKALQETAQRARSQAGFIFIDDPRTGVRIGVPMKLLPNQDVNPNGGSRWQSADGAITLDTRIAAQGATLQSLYDRNVAIQTPGRVVTYKVLRPDFFVIAGETPTGKFYTRYASAAEGIRAFSIGYDKAFAPQVDRIVVAIANSFAPFLVSAPPYGGAGSVAPAPQTLPPPMVQGQASRLIGTGLAVGPRQVVTAAPLDACKDVRVLGLKPQQVRGKGAFALDFAEDLKAKPVALPEGGMAEGLPLLILAFADEGSSPSLMAVSGLATNATMLTAPLQPGASGAPVLDERRGLIGLVGPVSSDQRRIAGVMPSASYGIVPVSDIARAFPGLIRSGQESTAPKASAADLVASLKGALVPIACAP